MDKYEFITYTARRYGIDPDMAETIVDIFASSLQDVVRSGTSLNIEEIGAFITTSIFDKKIVTFKPSDQLVLR